MCDKKNLIIPIRVNQTEKEGLELKSKAYNMSVSRYLRQLGLGYPIQSKVDQMALMELLNVKADLGRLGGLFKKWLVDHKDQKHQAKIGDRSYTDIDKIVDEIQAKEEKILEIAEKLLEL